jgi:hypothetical protein
MDLTEGSHGNACGIGLADFVTERLRAKVDWPATYANSLASKAPSGARLPIVGRDDADAVALALSSLTRFDDEPLRLVAMANTLEVNHLAISEALLADAEAAGYRVESRPVRAEFDAGRGLLRIGSLPFFPGAP